MSPHVIRPCTEQDAAEILSIVNEAAEAYRGVIPDDCFHEPYMTAEELMHEIDAGVRFYGLADAAERDNENADELLGVMGLQEFEEVALIRHAYVRPSAQRRGVGGQLLEHLTQRTELPLLVGTWAAAYWAIAFYEQHGFVLVTPQAKDAGLRKYWDISDRQVETSVVLADAKARVSIL